MEVRNIYPMKNNQQAVQLDSNTLLVSLIFACVGLLSYYLFTSSLVLFNSDTAANILYAKEIALSNQIFPEGWQYNNKDVFFYNYEYILALLLKFLDVGTTSHALASIIYAVLMLVIVYFTTISLIKDQTLSLIITALMASGISSPFITQLLYDWGASYGSNFILSLILWSLYVKYSYNLRSDAFGEAGNTRLSLLVISINLAIFIASLSNPSRSLMYFTAPLILTIFSDLLYGRFVIEKMTAKIIVYYCGLGVSVLLSHAAGRLINLSLYPGDSILTNPSIYPVGDLPEHFFMILKSWLFLFGYPAASSYNISGGDVGVASLRGAYTLAYIAFSIFSLFIPLIFYRKVIALAKEKNPVVSVALFPAISLFLAVLLHVVAFRYPQKTDYISIRYLFSPLLIVIVSLFAIYRDKFSRAVGKKYFIPGFIGTILLIGFMNYVYPSVISKNSDNSASPLVQCLETKGANQGFATFWNSHVVTVLSHDLIKSRPITIDGNTFNIFPFLNSTKWYSDTGSSGKSFILLTNKEYEALDRDMLLYQLGPPDSIGDCGTHKALLYSNPIANKLFGKSNHILIGEKTQHQVGVIDSKAHTIRSEINKVGYLMYGPYISIGPGSFSVTVETSASVPCLENACGFVEVTSQLGKKVLAKADIVSSSVSSKMVLPFDLEGKEAGLEIRVFTSGKSEFVVHSPIVLEKRVK